MAGSLSNGAACGALAFLPPTALPASSGSTRGSTTHSDAFDKQKNPARGRVFVTERCRSGRIIHVEFVLEKYIYKKQYIKSQSQPVSLSDS